MNNKNLLVFFGILILILMAISSISNKSVPKDFFYNVRPLQDIDPEFINPNENPYNYYTFHTIGDAKGVDLNCNGVSKRTLMKWIAHESPDFLYEHVYRYDPSININNPIHAPRVLKMLLRNLPEDHQILRDILKDCRPVQVRVE